jgi:hypothetical protein
MHIYIYNIYIYKMYIIMKNEKNLDIITFNIFIFFYFYFVLI